MSLNYPDRAEWLAIRATPRKPKRDRTVHVSTNLRRMKVKDPVSGVESERIIMMGKGNTYVRSEQRPSHIGKQRRERLRYERMVAADAAFVPTTDAPLQDQAAGT